MRFLPMTSFIMMKLIILYLAFLSTLAFANSKTKHNATKIIKADDQFAKCYDGYGSNGRSFLIDENLDDLSFYGVDDIFSSCCVSGIWILYSDIYYNRYNPNVSICMYFHVMY